MHSGQIYRRLKHDVPRSMPVPGTFCSTSIGKYEAPVRKPICSQKRLDRKLMALDAIQTAYSACPSSHLLSASSKSAIRGPLCWNSHSRHNCNRRRLCVNSAAQEVDIAHRTHLADVTLSQGAETSQ